MVRWPDQSTDRLQQQQRQERNRIRVPAPAPDRLGRFGQNPNENWRHETEHRQNRVLISIFNDNFYQKKLDRFKSQKSILHFQNGVTFVDLEVKMRF